MAPALAEDAEGGCDDCLAYTIMRPDRETLERWIEAYNNAPRAYIEMEGFQVPSPRGSLSLLDHLEYTPAERDQGTCGNCWAWAGTGVMEIALSVQEGIKNRLSIQYVNSNYNDGSGPNWACCGGDLSELANFYDAAGIAIPWSNTNAQWQDYSQRCEDYPTSVPAETISIDPNYPITSIQEQVVPTLPLDGVTDQATAIANIKNVLDQNKAVWFAFYLPNNSAWDGFGTFFASGNESDVYAMDQFCGIPYDDSPGEGGGHAVLCVGYNDDDPDNSYWVMLNSWGTTAGRPNGLFRINMDMDYQCVNDPYYSFYWQTLDVAFDTAGQPDITVSPISFDETLPPDTTQDYTLAIGNDGDADLTYSISDRETTGEGALAAVQLPPSRLAEREGLIELSPSESMSFATPHSIGTEIAYDDGDADNAYCWDYAGNGFAVRFTPPQYPVDLEIARFCFWPGWPDSNHEEFAVEVYDDDGAGGAPGTLLDGGTTMAPDWGWCNVDISPLGITITSGDFYVLYKQLTDSPDCEGLCVDENNPAGRSWDYFNGAWTLWASENYMIRCVVEVSEVNNPPDVPSGPSPAHQATGVSPDADLSWTGGDPDPGDTVTYDVYLDTTGATTLVSNDQSATTYEPGTLNPDTKYYWKIVAMDNHEASTSSPVWEFTTAEAADCSWLDVNPKSGSVAPTDSDEITVTIDTTGLAEGDYSAEIVIASNDPDEDPTIIPVTLHVSTPPAAEPNITVSPTSFDETLPPDTTQDYTLTIGNAGDAALTYDITDRETMGGSSGLAPTETSPPPPSSPGNSDADNVRPVEEPDIRTGAQEAHAPQQIFEEGDTLEELRDKIEQNGYNFTVDHNWVYDMSPEEKENFFGRHDSGLFEGADTSEDIGPLAGQLGIRQLPSQFDWRNYNGHSYIGAIRNQGTCGSCYAFGACAAAEGTYNLATGLYDGNCSDFSESFIIWCLGSLPAYNSHFYGCGGADYTYSELTALTVEGVSGEADFPYQTWDGCGDHWDDPRITFGSWYRIPCGDIDAIKTAIMTYGPIDAAVYVTSAFHAYSGGIYEDTNTDCYEDPCYNTPTNHCVALVGWDDNGDPDTNGYWILRNSWGADDWGEDGYMRIKYRSARVACAACYLVYSEDCPWLNVSPTSGSVAPTDSDDITVTIDTTGLAEGDYGAEIVITNNDPDENPVIVPVTLHVAPVPTWELFEGVNIITYAGATTSLPEALTNIAGLLEIIWDRGPWTGGEWYRFFFYYGFPVGELQELENGRAYIIVVSEACIWELPQ